MEQTLSIFEDIDKQELKSKLETLRTEINTVEILLNNEDDYLPRAIGAFNKEFDDVREITNRLTM